MVLLDVHHSRLAAARLRQVGHDVVAAADIAELATIGDEELLRRATAEGRALVSENVKNFARVVRTWVASGEHRAGVIFASPRRFHRGGSAYPENLVVGLSAVLDSPPEDQEDWVHWLQ
jgi:Domain of unknown function (DUF5615)